MRWFLSLLLVMILVHGAAAQGSGFTAYTMEGDFEDAAFGVETAIVDRGLVIDYVSHVGDMLNRTAADVGATDRIYERADVFLFCSSILSRKVMAIDPGNIAHCPYGIFVYQLTDSPDEVHVGYRHQPAGPMKEVEALLDAIAREAAGLD